jgi:hypothetical protein
MKKCTERINGRTCNGNMKHGLVAQDVWGRLDGRPITNGSTISAIGNIYVHKDALKCESCGHTVVNQSLYK